MTAKEFLNQKNLRDTIINNEDLPEYWVMISEIMEKYLKYHLEKNKSNIKLMWHIPTNQVGQFKKETNPTGKPTTIVIKLFDGRTYFAPKSEFKSFSLDSDF